MRIGIITTWFERGAAYVSKLYKEMLEDSGHSVYIFARGGENHESQKKKEWNELYVTRSTRYINTRIEKAKFYKWIKNNNIECLFFNEQQEYIILAWIRRKFPQIKLGAYVDYYTENTLKYYLLYDFVICNTKRHMQAMRFHPQKYYIEWGTDIEVFKPKERNDKKITFFHSAGMSSRKGTDILIESFISHKLYEKSRLIVHTQIPINRLCRFDEKELVHYNIFVIEKTVSAPGLYHLGDVYVYPTRLDGLGLTMYESLACGLPLITTDFPPMNEVGNKDIVKLVRVKDYYCRGDAYYFPLCICDADSLADQMIWYINHYNDLPKLKKESRQYAVDHYNIKKKAKDVAKVFETTKLLPTQNELCKEIVIKTLLHTSAFERLESYRFYHKMKNTLKG